MVLDGLNHGEGEEVFLIRGENINVQYFSYMARNWCFSGLLFLWMSIVFRLGAGSAIGGSLANLVILGE